MAKVLLNLLSQDNSNSNTRKQQQRRQLEAEFNITRTATTTPTTTSATSTFYENYKNYDEQQQEEPPQRRQHATTSKTHEQQKHPRQLYQRQLSLASPAPTPQLASATGNENARFSAFPHVNTSTSFCFFSSSYSSNSNSRSRRSSSSSNTSCGNMNAVTATEDDATLELSRKAPPFNKQLLQLDSRSFFYLALLVLVYCCVLMRASAAAAAAAASVHDSVSSATLHFAANKTEAETKSLSIVATQRPQPPPTPPPSAAATTTITTAFSKSAIAPETMPRLLKRSAANVPGHDNDNDNDSSYRDDEFDEYDALINNKSARGKYIGAPCNELKCETTLLHVVCDKDTQTCGCERNYPVQLGLTKGCDKPKKLGEQCFYDATCQYSDENSLCVQVRHNALCQCTSGFHSVSYTKPTRRVFCTQDLKELSSDLPTLLGVTTGIAVLAGLICMVLHLFSKTKYPRHRNFGDANLPPPIMYSSDTGIPLTVQSGRPSSRSSMRSSGSIGSYGNRRSSSGGLAGISNSAAAAGGIAGIGSGSSKGILVSTSRTGSRRPSLASVHSTSSSVRSYSMMRFEKETQQKEIRQEMKLRLARLQQQQQLNQNKPQIIIGDALVHHGGALSRITMPTPSPMTPNSLDELLPSVDEMQEYPPKPGFIAAATLAAIKNVATATSAATSTITTITATTITPPEIAGAAAYIGPCNSSTEAL